MAEVKWQNIAAQPSRSYVCGHCGNPLASATGWHSEKRRDAQAKTWIYICHFCDRPTFFDIDGRQSPGASLGEVVKDVSDPSVAELYEEARRATTAGAFTAAVLACRKLLMHVAVAKGAPAGEQFVKYVEYLATQNYVPPGAKPWVDHIRKKGNEANHEIIIMNQGDAAELLEFCGMLLKLIYEYPAAMTKKYPPKP